ncbi:RHS repeat-associated core domain-containing protein [Pseudomonas monteilii]|uniref:RHS repeat-associated core domain-containing protein n=1 Tax=Pseudomonas monteilii TaxID=76759 RepID=A0A399MA86_9PSED|nr:RHS repeat-associated core domain-containing protein [Pseudomonas monteilii]RII78109.1 RHS repeat-associated core domain-containing protein [Pseudomonas monteilii]
MVDRIARSTRCFFYSSNKALVSQVGGGDVRLLYGGNQLVAQKQASVTLLQTVKPNTVITTRGPEHAGAHTFTAYGFSPLDTRHAIVSFVGGWRDPVYGIYCLGQGYRWYSTIIQRFLSPDTLSPFGAGSLNAYAYCECDPVNFHDPSGRMKRGFTPLFGTPPKQRSLESALESAGLPSEVKPLIKTMLTHDAWGKHSFWATGDGRSKRKYTIEHYDSQAYQALGNETYFHLGQGVYNIEISGGMSAIRPESVNLRRSDGVYASWSEKVGLGPYYEAGFQWAGDKKHHPAGTLIDSQGALSSGSHSSTSPDQQQQTVANIRRLGQNNQKYV